MYRIPNAKGVLLCCAADDRQSFYEMRNLVRNFDCTNAAVVVLKSDLKREIQDEELQTFVNENKLQGYYWSSSKINRNCWKPFEEIFAAAIQIMIPSHVLAKAT
jgi:hypothetical protein